MLETNAASAIPELTLLAKDRTHRTTCMYARAALKAIGKPYPVID